MKKFLIFLLLLFVWGCGGGGDKNLPSQKPGSASSPQPIAAPQAHRASLPTSNGRTVHSLAYPKGIKWMGDLAFVGDGTFWALAVESKTKSSFLHIDSRTGAVLAQVPNHTPAINLASELAFDGRSIWATGYGWVNGILQGSIFQVDVSSGTVLRRFPCPATQTGFCEGLAWDGRSFWSGGSNSGDLVQFSPEGRIEARYADVWETDNIKLDLAYDAANGLLIAVKDGQPGEFDPKTNEYTAGRRPIPEIFKGTWDGHLWWTASNLSRKIEGRAIQP